MITLKVLEQQKQGNPTYLETLLTEKKKLTVHVIDHICKTLQDDYLVKFLETYSEDFALFKDKSKKPLDVFSYLIKNATNPENAIMKATEFFSDRLTIDHISTACSNEHSTSSMILILLNKYQETLELCEDELCLLLGNLLMNPNNKLDAMRKLRDLGATFDDTSMDTLLESFDDDYEPSIAMEIFGFFKEDDLTFTGEDFERVKDAMNGNMCLFFVENIENYTEPVIDYLLQSKIMSSRIEDKIVDYSENQEEYGEDLLTMLLSLDFDYDKKSRLIDKICSELEASQFQTVTAYMLTDILQGNCTMNDGIAYYMSVVYKVGELKQLKDHLISTSSAVNSVIIPKLTISPARLELNAEQYIERVNELANLLDNIDITEFNKILNNMLNSDRFKNALENLDLCYTQIEEAEKQFDLIINEIHNIKAETATIKERLCDYNERVQKSDNINDLISTQQELLKETIYGDNSLEKYFDEYKEKLESKKNAVRNYIIDTKTVESIFNERRQQFI